MINYRRILFLILMVICASLLMIASSGLSAQEGLEDDRVLSGVVAPPEDYYPFGDILDTKPFFGFPEEADPNITWYNVVVNDGATTILDEWYEASQICEMGNCYVFPDVVLFNGVGDKTLSWTLSGYNASTTNISAINTNNFTILAPQPTGPTTFNSPSGSPAFELNGIETDCCDEPFIYRVYIQQNSTNTGIIDEWVYVDDVECDEMNPDDCTVYLEPIAQPLYDDGSYTAWFQGFGEGFDYTAWSTAFNFTVDIPAPTTPTILPQLLDSFFYAEILGDQLLSGNPCVFDDPTYECTTGRPYFLFIVGDHGESILMSRSLDESLIDWSSGLKLLPDPITDATQWFEYRVMQGATVIQSEWIDSYNDSRCFLYGEGAESGLSVCILQPPILANGNYKLDWQTYNPGGLSGYDSLNFSINGTQPPPTVSVELDLATPLVNFDTGTTSEPEWAEVVVTDTSDDSVAFSEWMEVIGYGEFIQAIYEQMFMGEEPNQLKLLTGKVVCFIGCFSALDTYLLDGNYEVEVRTWAYGTMSPYSAPVALVIDNPVPTVPLDPGDMTVMRVMPTVEGNSRPIYGWSASAGTAWHNIVVEDEDGEIHDGWYETYDYCETEEISEELRIGELRIAMAEGDQACEAQPPVDLPPGDYTWKVRGWSTGGMGSFSPDQNLTISSIALTIPSPIDPSGMDDQYPVFSWSSVTNASWYQIQVENTGTNTIVYDEWVYVPASECGADCIYSPSLNAEFLEGNYAWRIRAANASAASGWSSTQSFTVENFVSLVQLYSPDEDYYAGDLTFYWLPAPTTTWYNVELYLMSDDALATAAELTAPIYSEWFNAELLNQACQPDWVKFYYEGGPLLREAAASPPESPIYCELELADADFPTGLYYWRVNTWGPTYGTEIYESEQFAPFWWQ